MAARLRGAGLQRRGRGAARTTGLRASASEPRASAESQGAQQQPLGRGATPTVHTPAAVPEPRASLKARATRVCARGCCGHKLAVPPCAHRHCPTPYRSCSPVTRTSAMRSSSLCCAPPLPLVLLSLPPLPPLPPSSMVGPRRAATTVFPSRREFGC